MALDALPLIYAGIVAALIFITLGTTKRWFSSSKSSTPIYSPEITSHGPHEEPTKVTVESPSQELNVEAPLEVETEVKVEASQPQVEQTVILPPPNVAPIGVAAPTSSAIEPSISYTTTSESDLISSPKLKRTRRTHGTRTARRATKTRKGAAA